jgi:hypothetical protein
VGLALTIVERLAIGAVHCQAGNHHRVASQGVSALLEMEVGIAMAAPLYRSSLSGPSNEPRQPAMGRSYLASLR